MLNTIDQVLNGAYVPEGFAAPFDPTAEPEPAACYPDWRNHLSPLASQIDTLIFKLCSDPDNASLKAEIQRLTAIHIAAIIRSIEKWPEFKELPAAPKAAPFEDKLLPESLRDFVFDIADRMQVPTDLPAAITILALGSVIGRRVAIQPRANDTDWLVRPNLWGAIVAPPGYKKSPVIHNVTRPLAKIEESWQSEDAKKIARNKIEREDWLLCMNDWRKAREKAVRSNKAVPDRPTDEEPAEFNGRRLIINDATAEALHKILADNPFGVTVIRDEIAGWIAGLDRQGRETERAFYLEAWNGDTPLTLDRIGRGKVTVPHCCVSMFGSIQPAVLRAYFDEFSADGKGNDGLMQRFQVLVWPELDGSYVDVDSAPDFEAQRRIQEIFNALAKLTPDGDQSYVVRFTQDAQDLFSEWITALEKRVRSGELPDQLNSHLAKYRSLMPSLALIFHLTDTALLPLSEQTGEVGIQSAQRAIDWCAYLESHARKAYGIRDELPGMEAARAIAAKILDGTLKDGFAFRDVKRPRWKGLTFPDQIEAGLRVLESYGWVRPGKADRGGRVPYTLNRCIARKASSTEEG